MQECLTTALKLIQFAKEIYKANPENKPLDNGTRTFKSNTPIERRKLLAEYRNAVGIADIVTRKFVLGISELTE